MKYSDAVFDAIIRNSIFHFLILKFDQLKRFNNLKANGQ